MGTNMQAIFMMLSCFVVDRIAVIIRMKVSPLLQRVLLKTRQGYATRVVSLTVSF